MKISIKGPCDQAKSDNTKKSLKPLRLRDKIEFPGFYIEIAQDLEHREN